MKGQHENFQRKREAVATVLALYDTLFYVGIFMQYNLRDQSSRKALCDLIYQCRILNMAASMVVLVSCKK